MSMKPKYSKRCFFTESDCHTLVDIVINYKNIVECKKTDAVTWKQKAAAWGKIAELYNSATTEPKTADQLRCKFDNLKKDVRKYEAQKRLNMLRTGGGIDELDIKEVMKLLYAKIKSIIRLSVKGLEPSIGDSDDVFPTGKDFNSIETNVNNIEISLEAEVIPSTPKAVQFEEIHNYSELNSIGPEHNYVEVLYEADITPSTSKVVELEEDFGSEVKKFDSKIPNTRVSELFKVVEEKNDWSDYTPKKLQSRKHTALQTKRKRSDSININEQQTLLKRKLLEEEAARNKEAHEQRMKREQEVHFLKTKNLVLQNEKLEIEIELLRKQLGTS